MVECDIRVPDKWPCYFHHPTMTPYEYFEDMSPLFCTTDVLFEPIGEHMHEHVCRLKLFEKPLRLPVGGMRACLMLVANLLLKCYLEHGMLVTKIYQVVEFTRSDVSVISSEMSAITDEWESQQSHHCRHL